MGTSIVTTFTESISGLASGVATTVVDVFNAICVNPEGGISNLAIWGIVFGTMGLVVGLTKAFTRKAG